MYCNGCGQPLAVGQSFCPRCGLTVGMVAGGAGPQGPGQQFGQGFGWMPAGLPLGLIDRRVHALAVGWLVYATVIGIGGLFGLAWAHSAFAAGETGSFWGWHGWMHHGWGAGHMPFFFWPFVTAAFFFRVLLALAAGVGLMRRARWGRVVAILAGCLALIHIPFGTALGIWTLVTLLQARNALGYEAIARS